MTTTTTTMPSSHGRFLSQQKKLRRNPSGIRSVPRASATNCSIERTQKKKIKKIKKLINGITGARTSADSLRVRRSARAEAMNEYADSNVSTFETKTIDADDDADAAADDEGEDDDDLSARALEVLQWQLVSKQVRMFCKTKIGRAEARALELCATRTESERALMLTAAMLKLFDSSETRRRRRRRRSSIISGDAEEEEQLRRQRRRQQRRDVGVLDGCFKGARDVRMFLIGAKEDKILSAKSFVDVYTTLGAIDRCADEIFFPNSNSNSNMSSDDDVEYDKDLDNDDEDLIALREATESLRISKESDDVQNMKREIERCINVEISSGVLRNEASEDLFQIRNSISSTAKTLRSTLNAIANEMAQKKFAERAQIVTRLGRECIPMKLGSAGQLKGIVLATSDSGQTVFKEPEEVIALNNSLNELKELEEMEIEVILKKLTRELKTVANIVQEALEVGMTTADLANAKSRHAKWISGQRPTFSNDDQDDDDESNNNNNNMVFVTNAQHPLLLEKYLLPKLPNPLDDEDDNDAIDGNNYDKQKAWDKLAPGSFIDESQTDNKTDNESNKSQTRFDCSDKIVPINFYIDSDCKAVAITGPNTGGKTASLKTLGILVLMARAGMYIPAGGCKNEEEEKEEEVKQILPFVKTVLCDLGDSQTLQLGDGGLSTFGAHIRRLKRILESQTEESLVLLDEPGSGTDPREGSALAVAVASAISTKSKLLVLTSHFEEVKQFALAKENEASRAFRVAAVRFDVENNRPTYELVWGKTEDSNALSISRGLGLDGDLLEEATLAHAKMVELENRNIKRRTQSVDGSSLDEEDEDANLAESLRLEREEQRVRLVQAKESLESAQDLKDRVFQETNYLKERVTIAKASFEESARNSIAKAQAECETASSIAEIEDIVKETFPNGWYLNARGEATLEDSENSSLEYIPKANDKVLVKMLGGAEAEVVSVDLQANEVTIRIGGLVTRSPMNGISKASTKQVFGRSENRGF
jgi:DNA mismatch repair protein MutS2